MNCPGELSEMIKGLLAKYPWLRLTKLRKKNKMPNRGNDEMMMDELTSLREEEPKAKVNMEIKDTIYLHTPPDGIENVSSLTFQGLPFVPNWARYRHFDKFIVSQSIAEEIPANAEEMYSIDNPLMERVTPGDGLKTLYIDGSPRFDVSSLTDGDFKNLKSLSLVDVPTKDALAELLRSDGLESLETLTLESGLTEADFPPLNEWNLPNLSGLFLGLGANEIRSLDFLCATPNDSIRVLFLSGNPIKEIPAGLFDNLHKLSVLDLSDTDISDLPDIPDSELKVMFVSNCKRLTIEKVIAAIKNKPRPFRVFVTNVGNATLSAEQIDGYLKEAGLFGVYEAVEDGNDVFITTREFNDFQQML